MALHVIAPSRGAGDVPSDVLRDRFLSRSTDDLPGVRPIVARSWFRSRAAGVDGTADKGAIEPGRVDEHTMDVAAPHLRSLDDLLGDVGGYVTISAPNGALIHADFLREEAGFPSGYSLTEASCGTNADGLALEEGRGVWLAPEEHFRDDMRSNWCFASLIRDPFHNRARGVIGLTIPAHGTGQVDPAATLLMLEGVAARINHEIEKRTSSKERALLREFLTISRRHGGAAVIALDGKNAFMNANATAVLEGDDFTVISGYASEVMATGSELTCEVSLHGTGPSTLEIGPIQSHGTPGVIIVLKSRRTRRASTGADGSANDHVAVETGLTDLHSMSEGFRRTVIAAQTATRAGRSVSIIGERGTGKARVAETVAADLGSYVALDFDDRGAGAPRIGEFVQRLASEQPPVAVLENADSVDEEDAAVLARFFAGAPGTALIMTIEHPNDRSQQIVEACGAQELTIEPLRHRREDIPSLAGAIAEEYGSRLSRNLVSILTSADWPRNIDQLRGAITHAAHHAKGYEITVEDLPQAVTHTTSSGRVSRLEESELRELRTALRETDGNRRRAADLLGIGRSTLYRRMDYFRSRGFDL